VTAQQKLCGFLQFLQNIMVAIISYYQYNCHHLNNRATAWKIRATIVAYQCQKGGISMPPYIYFATTWQFPCHHRGISMPKGGISMPPYIHFCHRFWKDRNFLFPLFKEDQWGFLRAFGPLPLAAWLKLQGA
jgi:hypothetical protein